jgi:photosystem II stability/assembly factor-like uncharacterized protein
MSKPIYTRLQTLTGTKIVLHFSLPLATNTNIDKNDFQLFLGGVSKTIDSVLTNAGYLIIDHSETITNPKLIRVSYTKNGDSSKNIAASGTNGGGVVDSFSAVDNLPPRVVQQTISSSSTIDLIFDDYIVDNANIDSADFDFKLDNVSKTITNVATTDGRVVVSLSAGGTTWTEDTSVGATKDWWAITSSTDGTKMAAIMSSGNIWTSSNSGATWTEDTSVGATKYWGSITSSADGTKLVAGEQGGNIWTSSNSGATWTEITSTGATKAWYGITSSADGTKLAAVAQGGNIWTSSNSGATWTENTSIGATHNWWGITSSADGTKIVAVENNIWRSSNSGATWTVDTSVGSTKSWRNVASSADGTKMWATVMWGNLWSSNDSGATWTENTSTGATKGWWGITSSADGTNLAAVVTGGNIWTSNDSGTTWTENTSTGATKSWRAITSSADGTKLGAGYLNGNIWTAIKELPTTISNIELVDITYTKNATSSKNIVDEAGNAAENFSSFGQSNEFNENYITNEASQWHFITFNRNKGTSSDELNSGNFVYNTEGSTEDTNFGHKFIVGYKEAGMSSGIIVGNSYLKTNINDYGAFILDNGSSINPVKIENGNNIMVGAGSYTTNGSKMVKNPHFRFAFNPMTYKYAWYYASMWVQPSYSDNTSINNLRDNHLFQQLCCGTYIPGSADLFKLWGDSTNDLYTSLNTGLTRSGTETHKSLDEQYSKKISASFASHNGFKPISYYDDLDLRSWVYHAYNGSWDGKTLVFSTHKTGDTAAGYNGVNQKKVLIADFDGTQNIFNINYTTFIEEQSLYMGTGTNHITVKDDWMAIYWKGSGANHTRIYKKTNGTWNATHHSFVAGSQPKLYKTKTGEYYLLTSSTRHYYNSNTDSWDSHSEMTVSLGSMESDKNGFIPKRIITNISTRKIYVWSDVNETYNEVDILGYTNSWNSAAADDSPGFGLRVAIWNDDNITVMKYENGKFVNEENGLIRIPISSAHSIYFKKNTIVYRTWSKHIKMYKKIKNHWILTNEIMHTPGPYGAMGIHVCNNKMVHFDHESGGYGSGAQFQRVGSVSYLEMSSDYSPEFCNAIVPAVINNVTDTTNTKIGVYFSEDLVKNKHIDKNDFTVNVNGVSAVVSTAEIIDGDVILTMSSAITNGQTATINYTANSDDMKKLKGYGTKYIKSFSSEAQENVYLTAAKGWGDQTYNTPYGETITELRTGGGSFHIAEKRKLNGNRIYAPQAAKSVVVSFDITREKFDKIETQSYFEGGSNKFPTGVSMVLKHGDALYVNSTTKIYKFLETTSTWSTVITNLSSPTDGFIYNNNFYYVTNSLTSIQKFDPTTDTLSTVTISGTPPSLSGYTIVVCQNDNELYFYANKYDKQSFLYKIDLGTNSGSQIVYTTNDDDIGYDSTKASTNSYFYGVFNPAIFYHGGNVYLFGGQRGYKKNNVYIGQLNVNTIFKINVSDKIISKVNYHGYFHQTAFTNSQPIVINDEVYIWSPSMNNTVWFKMIFDKHTTGVKSVTNNVGLIYKTMTVRTLDQSDSTSGTNRVYKTADSIMMYAVGNEESSNDEFITQDKIWPAFSWQHSYGSKGAALSTEYKIKDKNGTDKTNSILNQNVTQKYFTTFSSSQFKVITPNAGLVTDGISIDEIRAFGTGKGWLDGGRTGEMSYVLISTKAHAAMKNAGDQVDVYFRFPKTTKPKYWIKDMYEVAGQDYYYIFMFTAEKVSGSKNFDSWMTWEYQYDILPEQEPVLSNWTPQIENAYVQPGNTYQLILLFDTIIEYPATLDATLFTVKINGTSISVTNAILHSEIDKKNKITITLGIAPNVGDTMTVSYSKPTDAAKKIGASNTRSIDSFTDVSVRAQTFKYMSKGLNYRYWSFGSSNMANGLFYGLCRGAGSYMYVGDDNGYDQYYTGTVGNQNHWPIYRFSQLSNGFLNALSFIDFKDKNGNVRNDFIMAPKNFNEISADYIARGGNFGTGFDSSHGGAVYLNVFPNAGGSSGSAGGNKSEGDWNSYTGGSQVVIMWNDPRDIYVYFRAKKTAPAWNNVNSQLKLERPDDSVNYYMLMFHGTFKKYDTTNRDVRSIGQMIASWDALNSSHSTYTWNGRSGSDDLSRELRNKKAPKNVYDITEFANSRLYSPTSTPWRDLEASDVGHMGMYDKNHKKVYNGKFHIIETGNMGVPAKPDTFGPSPKKAYLHNINHSQIMLYFDEFLSDGLALDKNNWIIKIITSEGTSNAKITGIKYEANFILIKIEEIAQTSNVVTVSYTAPTNVSNASLKDNKGNYVATFVDFSIENNLLVPGSILSAETFDGGRKIKILMSKNFKLTDYFNFVSPMHFSVNGTYSGSVSVSDVMISGGYGSTAATGLEPNQIVLLMSCIFVKGETIKFSYVPHSQYNVLLKDLDGTPMVGMTNIPIVNNSTYEIISELTCNANSSNGGSLELGNSFKVNINKESDVGETLEWNGNNNFTSNILWSYGSTPWTVADKITNPQTRNSNGTSLYTVQENDYYIPHSTTSNGIKHAIEGTAGYKGHWFQFDMGSVMTIDNLWMLNGYSTNHIYRIKEFVVCGSNDFAVTDTTYPFVYSGTWTYIDTVDNVNNLMPDTVSYLTAQEDLVNIKFNSASYRYWRVVVTKQIGTASRIDMYFCSLPKQVSYAINVISKNATDDYKHRAAGNIINIGQEKLNYITDEMIPHTGWSVNDIQFKAIYAEENGPFNLAALYGVKYYLGYTTTPVYTSSSYFQPSHIFIGSPWKAFQNSKTNHLESSNNYMWASTHSGSYNGSGDYTGNHKTGSNDYEGEWLQVDLGESNKIDSIIIYPGTGSYGSNYFKDCKVFASNDDTNWTEVLDISGLTNLDWVSGGVKKKIGPYNLTNQTWRYWRLVINKTINHTRVYVGEFMLMGNINVTWKKHLFNYYSVVQNKWLKLGKLSGGYYLINDGIASFSSIYQSTNFNRALDTTVSPDLSYPYGGTADGPWGWWSGTKPSASTETTDGYSGEWLQLENTYKIKVEKISIISQGSASTPYKSQVQSERLPKNYRIYGSDDKVSWTMLVDETNLTTDDWQVANTIQPSASYVKPRIHVFNALKEYKVYRLVVNECIGDYRAAITRIKFFTPIDQTNDTFQNFKQSNYNSPQSGGGEINASSMVHSLNTSISKLLPVLPVYKKMTIKPKNWTVGQDPTSVANLDGIKIGKTNLNLRFNYNNATNLPELVGNVAGLPSESIFSDNNIYIGKIKTTVYRYPYYGTRKEFKVSPSTMNLYYDKEFVFYFWAGDADAAENKYHIFFSKKDTPTGQPEYFEWMNYNYNLHGNYHGKPWFRGFPVKSLTLTEPKEFTEFNLAVSTTALQTMKNISIYGNFKGRQSAWSYTGEFSSGWKDQDWLLVDGKDAHLVGYDDNEQLIFDSDSTDSWDRIRKSEIETKEMLPTLADPSIPQRPSVSKAELNVSNKVLITFTTNVVLGTPTLTDFKVKLNNKLLILSNVVLTSGKIEITMVRSVIPHSAEFPQVVTVSYVKSEILEQQMGALLPVDTFIDTSVNNNLAVEAVNEVTPTAENAGITAIAVTTKTESLIPANTTRSSSGKYEFTNIAQSIAVVADDTPSKKRLRTKKFIKAIFSRIKTLDNTINTQTEGIKINREILAFPDEAKKKVKSVVRVFDVGSTIDTSNIPEEESVYIPLEVGQACTMVINSVSYRFIKQSSGTLVSPPINNKSTFAEGDIEIIRGMSIVFGSVSVQSEPAVIHIPVIFDLSGNMETFVSGDRWNPLYSHRHRFDCGGLGVANVTANLFKNAFSMIQQRYDFTVTVVNDNGQNKFAFDGVIHDQLLLTLAQTYKFIPSPTDLFTNHPLRFSVTSDGTHNGGIQYNTGVTTTNTGDIMLSLPSTLNNTTNLYTNDASNAKIYYYCDSHSNMGNFFDVSDQQAIFTRNSDASCNALRDSFTQQLTTEGVSNIVHDISWSDIYTPEDTVDQGNAINGYVKTRNNVDYTNQITSTGGNSVGEILLRYMSTHLTGHPLGQSFIKNDTAFINQINGLGNNTANIANVLVEQMKLGLSENGTAGGGNYVLDTLFKQLKKQDPGRCGLSDTKKDFPLLAGDKVIIYISAKINVAADISKSVDSANIAIAMTNEVFPNNKYPYMDDATGVLDAGTWMITLTIS